MAEESRLMKRTTLASLLLTFALASPTQAAVNADGWTDIYFSPESPGDGNHLDARIAKIKIGW